MMAKIARLIAWWAQSEVEEGRKSSKRYGKHSDLDAPPGSRSLMFRWADSPILGGFLTQLSCERIGGITK